MKQSKQSMKFLLLEMAILALAAFVSMQGCTKVPLEKNGLPGCIEVKGLNDAGEALHSDDPHILVLTDSDMVNGIDSSIEVQSLYRSNLLDNYGATYDSTGLDKYIVLYFHDGKNRKRSTIYYSLRELSDTTGVNATMVRWGVNGFGPLYNNSRTPHLIEVCLKVQFQNKPL